MKRIKRFKRLMFGAALLMAAASTTAQEVGKPVTRPSAEDIREFARRALREGRMGDAELALELGLSTELAPSEQNAQLADELSLVALELGDDETAAAAQAAARRAWELAPLPRAKPGTVAGARKAAARWYLAAMVQWKLFGNIGEARVALAKAIEIDAESQVEAQHLINYFDALDREATIKSEANLRAAQEGRKS